MCLRCENDKVKLVPVEIGIQDNNYIEIKKGLSKDQKVVEKRLIARLKMLKNSDVIEVVKENSYTVKTRNK